MDEVKRFQERLTALRIDPAAIECVKIYGEHGGVILNKRGKEGSIQVYSAISSNDGYISPANAKKGLALYGAWFRKEAKENPGKHPEIDRLEKIARSGNAVRCDVVRRESARALPEGIVRALPEALRKYPTPFYIYDEQGIRDTARAYKKAFSWVKPAYKNYFAVKACPNPHIVNILKDEGFGADCSSLRSL
jgi:hypothetical protein